MASVEAAVCLLADTSFAHELETSTCNEIFFHFYFTEKNFRTHQLFSSTFQINVTKVATSIYFSLHTQNFFVNFSL